MTATEQAEVFIPTGHPVRRAVIALGLVVVVLVVSWAGGLVEPRVTAVGSSGEYDVLSHDGTLAVALRNEAFAGIELHGARVLGGGVTTVAAELDGVPLATHPPLGGNETGQLSVRYRVDCDGGLPDGERTLELTARTSIGITRTVEVQLWRSYSDSGCW